MPKITFVSADGTPQTVVVPAGISAMEAALQNGIEGIDGDCGGAVACGTCHVYVSPEWMDRTGPAHSDDEREMLGLTDSVRDNSRLACQIVLDDELDGLVLITPAAQH